MLHASEHRALLLIQHVDEHPCQTESELAEWLDVELDALGPLISAAEALLPPGAHLEQGPTGLRLKADDHDVFSAWRRAMLEEGAFGVVPSTPSERVSFLSGELLARSTWITIEALADLMFCSRRTFSNDLKAVQDRLGHFGLELERKPHYGIRIAGNEMERRIALGSLLLDRLDLHDDETTHILSAEEGQGDPAADPYGIERISALIERITDRMGFAIRPIASQNLVVHIAVAVARLKNGHVLPEDNLVGFEVEDAHTREVAHVLADEVERAFGVSFPAVEVDYIALHLAGKNANLPPVQGTGPLAQGEAALDVSANAVAQRMVDVIYRSFHIDLRSDRVLRHNLARHIGPLCVRLKYHMNLENPLLEDVKSRYPSRSPSPAKERASYRMSFPAR